MTVAVGFHCSNGIVVAADSMLTPSDGQNATGHHTCRKVHVLSKCQIFAFAGDLGQADRFRIIADGTCTFDTVINHPIEHGLGLTQRILDQFSSTGIANEIDLLALLGFCYNNKAYCCSFQSRLQPTLLSNDQYFISVGAGKQIADPFLRFLTDIFCKDQPTVREAVFLAYWVVSHVIEAGPGGVGGPVRIATIEESETGLNARELSEIDIGEQIQAVASAGQTLRAWRDLLSGRANAEASVNPPQRPPSLGAKSEPSA